jgi:hypothetical protein
MGLVISKGLTLRKGWQPMDTDAAAYITAVETADGQALEEKTKIAIDNFVLGCKADGIWSAIKASCILAGARTRIGALTPLVGTAPTSFNFVDGDYNRKTGLVGDGSTKNLDSNRAGNADPQNNCHLSVYATARNKVAIVNQFFIGNGIAQNGSFHLVDRDADSGQRVKSNAFNAGGPVISVPTLFGASRSNSVNYVRRINGSSATVTQASDGNLASNHVVFFSGATARIAFYSIGESLNLALLDARVTDLINAFGAAIP